MTKFAIRSMICAPKGFKLVQVDLSQAEAWVVAFRANEPRMKHALMFADIHTQTARAIFELGETQTPSKDERFLGKKFNHACNYQMGPIRAAEVINKESDKPPYITISISEAKKLHKKWNEYYSLQPWWTEIREKLQRDKTITTVYRFRRVFYGNSHQIEKEATAFEPQSTIAHHALGKVQPEVGIEGGLLGIYKKLVKGHERDIRITNTSHDSGMFEIRNELVGEIIPQIVGLMRRPMVINGEEFTVPVDCEVGERWGEMEKVKL